MLERDLAMSLLEVGLRHSSADQTEILLTATDTGLTRLANSGIHQNIAVTNQSARVRAVVRGRIGVAADNRQTNESLPALVDRAIAAAKVSEPNPEFHSLPGPATITPLVYPDLSDDDFTPERRAEHAATLIRVAESAGLTASGKVASGRGAYAIGNSLGVRAYQQASSAGVMSIMTLGDASGYAAWDGRTLADAPSGAVAARAAGICQAARDAQPGEPGRYTVILEPAAVAEMLVMLALMGLGAVPYLEERSFMTGKLGQPLVGANISLRDDTYHSAMIGLPFDFEGAAKQVVPLFEHGVAVGVVFDSLTARKAGVRNTGHALPAPNSYGPLPLNLVLDHGTHSREAMLSGVEHGLLVTRFHYVNIVHPKETTITGMTRDGTFLIEGGAVTRPLKNLRFTQSILEALNHVTAIEHTQHLVEMDGLYVLAPSLRIEGFAFTS